MKDTELKACVGIGAIVACYAIYSLSNPGMDGAIFATILAAVTGLAGYSIAKVLKKE